MIDLNDDNDPYLFAVTFPGGKLVVQYMEVLAAMREAIVADATPTSEDIVAAVRKASRTPDLAGNLADYEIIAAWHRMTKAMEKAGNV